MSIIKTWCPPWWKRGPLHPGEWVAAHCPLCFPQGVLGALTGTGGLTRGHLCKLLSSPTRAPWDVRACPQSFSNPCLQPRVSQFCTCASGFRPSQPVCRLYSCGSNKVKEQILSDDPPRASDWLCSINNLVRWAELD